MAEKKEEAKAVEIDAAKKEMDDFIARKMKAVNEMESPAKARRAAVRLLQNRKVGK